MAAATIMETRFSADLESGHHGMRCPFLSRASARSHLSLGRGAGPAFERMIECAVIAVAEKPRDLGDWQIGFSQIARGEIEPQTVEYLDK